MRCSFPEHLIFSELCDSFNVFPLICFEGHFDTVTYIIKDKKDILKNTPSFVVIDVNVSC